MAQILVRNLEDDVKARLQRRARRNGRSTEEEVRDILRNAVRGEGRNPVQIGTRIASRFRGRGLERDIAELRENQARPAQFAP